MAVSMGVVVGLIKALGANPEAITQAVNDWLDDHPEATTTVEDGSITYAKLASALAAILDGKYAKPSGGIPASDLADDYIEEPASEGTSGQVLTTDGSGGRTWTTVQGGGGGTSDYTDLTNKPQINSVTLSGNKSLSDLGVTVSVVTPESGSTFTLSPCPVTYAFGEKAELTVTVTATSQYHFSFSSPSGTATVLTMNGITGTAGDTVEAGKYYEVDVWAGVAFVKAVEVTAVT